MAELEPVDRDVEMVVPLTGEIVDLRNPNKVAAALHEVRDLERQLYEARRVLEFVIREEASRLGTKTMHLGEHTATVRGGTKIEYDIEELRDLLRDAGLPEERLEKLIVETVTRRVDQRVARQLAGANPTYKAALEATKRIEPISWYVTIERRGR